MRRRLLAEFEVDPDRVVVNPLPISVERTAPRPEGARPTVLFFGTFRRNKGIEVLLRAIESLRGETDARFHFAGRGFPEVESEVTAAARQLIRSLTTTAPPRNRDEETRRARERARERFAEPRRAAFAGPKP